MTAQRQSELDALLEALVKKEKRLTKELANVERQIAKLRLQQVLEKHGVKKGSIVSVGNRRFKVTDIMTSDDYGAPALLGRLVKRDGTTVLSERKICSNWELIAS